MLEIVWKNVFSFILYHYLAFHGLFYLVTGHTHWATFAFNLFLAQLSNLGTISGAHRLWTHRSYQAQLPLKLFLMFCNNISNQNSIYDWVRDHRVHHKFSDTDADPHNIKRGFFFAHMGWLMVRKHPEVTIKGQTLDFSDIDSDKLIQFQRKYFKFLAFFCSIFLPVVVPWYYWGENWYVSLCITFVRYVGTLHGTWLVNSAAHVYGTRPYDSDIKPTENPIVAYITMGEGWHNYHHTFPWDYRASEFDSFNGNVNTVFINFMAKVGLAHGLKTASLSLIQRKKLKSTNSTTNKKQLQK
ncbi:Acyl-CoA desaturase-like Protein [Tribolium castaneum]|nr:Acyl-CoA desaturase-like Protein [Tribolium castaneum]